MVKVLNLSNKKAWIRIVEAVIAIIIIGSAILVTSLRQGKESDTESIYEKQKQILEIISNNNYRMEILSSDNLPVEIGMENPDYTIDELVKKTIPKNWDFNIVICEIDDICSIQTPIDRDVYVSETIISANFSKYEKPRKIEFFVWIK